MRKTRRELVKMREVKLEWVEKAELDLMNTNLSVREWENWAWKNKVKLIIEGGKVTGLESEPVRYK